MPNPKNLKPAWKEGDPSPNPSGRPKGSRNRSTIAREMLQLMERVKNPVTLKDEELDQEQIMTLAMLNKARKGDVRAYEALMNSAFGYPMQEIVKNTTIDLSLLNEDELELVRSLTEKFEQG